MSTPRVLLLEDDPSLASLIVEFFESEGIEAARYNTHASLCAAIRATPHCVVVADFWGVSQARLSACEADQIRELGASAPTILVSGRAWASTVTAEELNVACVLGKPLELAELLARVASLLSNGMNVPG